MLYQVLFAFVRVVEGIRQSHALHGNKLCLGGFRVGVSRVPLFHLDCVLCVEIRVPFHHETLVWEVDGEALRKHLTIPRDLDTVLCTTRS